MKTKHALCVKADGDDGEDGDDAGVSGRDSATMTEWETDDETSTVARRDIWKLMTMVLVIDQFEKRWTRGRMGMAPG